jgi:hypothetical protein
MAKARDQTRVSEVLGIEYPIIQGPLGGPRCVRFIHNTKAWSTRMRVELFPPDSETELRHLGAA